MKVTLREKVAAKYDGILEPDERASLEVVSVSSVKHGRVVSVRTASGVRLVLPRAHVTNIVPDGARDTAPGLAPATT